MGMYYPLTELVIIPSLKEALPGAIRGTGLRHPCSDIDNQAAQEIYGDHSTILVRSGDVEMLIHKVNELLNLPDLIRSLSEKGLENARTYNLPLYILALDRVYREILNQ